MFTSKRLLRNESDRLLTKKEAAMAKYVCTVCQWVYDEEQEGTKFADLPDNWTCPICGVEKEMFELQS